MAMPQATEAPAKLTGVEMMIRSLIKLIGIKPEELLQPLAEIRDKVVEFDGRLDRLERQQKAIAADIEAIKSCLQTRSNPNG